MLTRSQICNEYKITPVTFGAIKHLLEAEGQSKHGNILYDLTPNDDLALACARNHNASFTGDGQVVVHLLPFHRFLCLRFLTVSLGDLMTEMQHRNMVSARLGHEYVKRLHGRFIRRIPKPLQDLAKKKDPPPAKLKKQYRLMLDVLGISVPYERPMWMELFFEFTGDPRVKQIVEAIFTTRGEKSEHQETLQLLTGHTWRDTSVDVYRTLFYDLYSMDEGDWTYYLSLLQVSERKYKMRASKMTTVELRVQESLKPDFQGTMELTARELSRAIGNKIRVGTDSTKKELGLLIGLFERAGLGKGWEPGGESQREFFPKVTVVPKKSNIKSLQEVEGPKVARIKNA